MLRERIIAHAWANYHVDKWRRILLALGYGMSVQRVLRTRWR